MEEVVMEEFSNNRAVEVALQLTREIKTLLLQTLSDLLPTQDHLDQGPLEQHLLDLTHLDHHRMDQDHLVQALPNLQDLPTVHLLPPKVDSRGLQQILEIEVGPKWAATMVATTTIPSTLPTEVAIAVATIIMTLIVTDIVAIPSAGIKAVGATIRVQAAVEAAITASSFVHIVVMASKKAMRNAMMETMTPWTGKFQAAYSF
jgi:tryptophan synthase alpha subunit